MYFRYTPGILRAFVHPDHFTPLTFMYQPVLETKMGVKFIFGEVNAVDGDQRLVTSPRVVCARLGCFRPL